MGRFPNPDTQFKPGGPGGPGVPKGTKHISTWIQEMLNDPDFEIVLEVQGKEAEKITGAPLKAIINTAVIRAAGGDKQWADWLANNGYGSKVIHSNDPENPMPDSASKTIVDTFIDRLKDDTADKAKSN